MKKHRIKFEHEGRILKGSVKMYSFLADCVRNKCKTVTVYKHCFSIMKKRKIKGIEFEFLKFYSFDFRYIRHKHRFWIDTYKASYFLHKFKDLRDIVRNPEAIQKKFEKDFIV